MLIRWPGSGQPLALAKVEAVTRTATPVKAAQVKKAKHVEKKKVLKHKTVKEVAPKA